MLKVNKMNDTAYVKVVFDFFFKTLLAFPSEFSEFFPLLSGKKLHDKEISSTLLKLAHRKTIELSKKTCNIYKYY